MTFIFNSGFTTDIAMYIIHDGDYPADKLPYTHIRNTDMIESVIEKIGLNMPNEIIFFGKSYIYKQIEEYYKKINSEVKVTWR